MMKRILLGVILTAVLATGAQAAIYVQDFTGADGSQPSPDWTTWVSGDFSSSDYDSANGVSGYWVDDYNEGCELDVTDVISDVYDEQTNYGIVLKSSATITHRSSENSQSLRPSLEITYYYD